MKKNHSMSYYQPYFREPSGPEYKKSPVLMYGCSFCYGLFLEEKERPDYVLSELTKRPVYNFSIGGKGLQHALFMVENQKKTNVSPEYFLYIFYSDQLRRLLAPCGVIDNEKFLNYKIINDKIVFYLEKTDFFKNSYLYRKLSQIYLYHNQQIYISDYTYRIFKLFLKEMNEKIHQNYPDAKFIFVFYDGNPFGENRDLKQTETEQFKIIDLKDILDSSFYENPKYKIPNDEHPSADAWKVVIPEIVKNSGM